MKIIFKYLLIFLLCNLSACKKEQKKLSLLGDENYVYICGNTGAARYHYSSNCRGLRSCDHEVVKTTLGKAQGLGLTICSWED